MFSITIFQGPEETFKTVSTCKMEDISDSYRVVNAERYTLACIDLHNYLRQTNNPSYC